MVKDGPTSFQAIALTTEIRVKRDTQVEGIDVKFTDAISTTGEFEITTKTGDPEPLSDQFHS